MKKLNKEQANWLIEVMKRQRNEPYWKALIGSNEFAFMEAALNQCTEKEFPIFTISLDNRGQDIYIAPYGAMDGRIEMQISFDNTITQSIFYTEEFIEFTQGCNKIVEYLNES